MTLVYRVAAGVELGRGHAERIAILFGAAFVLDESLAICGAALESLKCARIRSGWAAEARRQKIEREKAEAERLRNALRGD